MNRISAALIGAFLSGTALAGAPADWSKVPAKTYPMFYPGQSGLEWIYNKTEHTAANQILEKGRGCTYCHDEDAKDIGKKVVEGQPAGNLKQPLEPNPPKGKPGTFPITVRAAHDGQKLYLRFEWDDTGSPSVKADAKNDVKVTVMFEEGKVEGAKLNGCWVTCHMDMRGMPEHQDAAKKNAKAKALGWEDGVTKYIKESRTGLELTNKPRGGWDKLKSDADLAAALKEGKFMDLMQFRSGDKPVDGHVLETRAMSGGKALVNATGSKQGNKWVVTFERNLAGGAPGDHSIATGKLYPVGFAVHDGNSNGRMHYVSLGYAMGMDNTKADINIVKQ